MTAAPQAAPRGPAANRLRLGIAGFGMQGARLAAAAAAIQGVEIAAVADVYTSRLARAKEIAGDSLVAGRDYRALFQQGVDAVIVATPDHLHAPIAQQALAAGKDVYIEAPLAHTSQEAAAIVKTASDQRRICYCGSGRTGSPLLAKARAIVASGRLGAVTAASVKWGTAGAVDAWQLSFPPDASPDSIDFHAFLGTAPPRPFDLKRFFRWRSYWDYGGGLAADRLAPLVADLHGLLNLAAQPQLVAGGGLHRWKDGRETPDVLSAIADYAGGPTVTLSATLNGTMPAAIEVCGTDASMIVETRRLSVRSAPAAEAYGEMANTLPREYRDWYYMMHGMSNQGQVRSAVDLSATAEDYDLPDGGTSPLAAQLNEFVNAVRTRVAPAAALQAAADAAAIADRINAAYREKERR